MSTQDRLHALDAVRAFALLLGIAFHASMSFIPGMPPAAWSMTDNSPSVPLAEFAFVAHMFRMSLFFFIAGFFARLLYQRYGARGFWGNRLMRIAVPMIVGWVFIYPMIVYIWTQGLMKEFGGKIPAMPPEMAAHMPHPVAAFPMLHLWFLYYLLMLYAVAVVGRALVVRLDGAGYFRARVDRLIAHSINGFWANLALGIPLVLCLVNVPHLAFFTGIPTPDQSLLPQAPAFVGYGTALVFGWLVNRQPELLNAIARRWQVYLAVGIAASGVCVWMFGTPNVLKLIPAGPDKLMYASAFAVAAWSWTFAITGIAVRYLSSASPFRRYIADSSYWLYLAHLPLVAAFGVLVGRWNLHWSLKYLLVLGGSLAILFATYHLLVRPTFIGKVLNGRKYPLRKPKTPQPSPAADSSSSLATLSHASKRYGKIVALDSVDMSVKRGELVALLGPNGAGKTTAISLWLGLTEPDSGNVTLMGGSPLDVVRRREIGVMMQEVELARELKVRELIALTSSYYRNPLPTDEVLELTRTTSLAQRPYSKLSGGQKRQVQFALAICGQPQLLFLDEPTVGLDIEARAAMWETIRKLVASGCSIVLTTHYLEEAEALADRVIMLANSRVVASGSVEEMRSIVNRRQVSCDSKATVAEVLQWPEVVAATLEDNRLRIVATDAEAVVRRLLALDTGLRNLEVRQAALADAFTKLTKEAA